MNLPVAVFNLATSWSGRTITYDESRRRFILQDHGPITAQGVLSHGALNRLEWAREGLREWLCDFADWERAYRPEAQAAGQSSRLSEDSSGEAPTVPALQGRVAVTAGDMPAGIAGSGPKAVASGTRSPRRRRYLSVAVVAVVMTLVVAVALLPTGPERPGGTTSAKPATGAITDPSVTLSLATTRFVNVIRSAADHCANAWDAPSTGGYTKQYRAALDDLRKARAIEPKNDGSKQWSLAQRFASCVACAVKYESLVSKDKLDRNAVAEKRDTKAFHAWWQRIRSAYNGPLWREIWAGYSAVGQRFTSVTATWTQPQVYFKGSAKRWVAIWVGLDGKAGISSTVEQTGTQANCQGGSDPWADYFAWYEMFPKPPFTIATAHGPGGSQNMVENPRDTITATVTSLSDRRFRLTLIDDTKGERFSIIETSRDAKCYSAEIIVESLSGDDPGLPGFDPVHFTNCAIDGRPIASFHLQKTDISAIGGLAMTSTSALGDDSTSFTVTRR